MLQHVKVGHIALSQNGHFYFWAKKGAPDLFTTHIPFYKQQVQQVCGVYSVYCTIRK